jgi:regulator of sigma E protease
MTIVLFILILIVLILVHELGHFSIAKFFNIRVDEFGVFFPPRLFAIKKGETEYSFNLLPLGGFVKIFGENYTEGAEDPRSFVRKNRLVQASVLVAGIVFNILFAWLVLSMGYLVGMPTSSEHKGFGHVAGSEVTVINVYPDSPAARAGVKTGDILIGVETGHGEKIDPRTLNIDTQSTAVTNFILAHNQESLVFYAERDGAPVQFIAKANNAIDPSRLLIGLELDDIGTLKLPPHLALAQGAILSYDITRGTAVGLLGFFKQLFVGKANFGDVSGPIGITVFGAAALKEGFAAATVLTALISINLAIINLLPIPGLDGGRLLIVGIEAITRRPVSPNLAMKLTIAGFSFLILLMLLVSYHDIAKLLG